jgi:hypothetical protein
MAKPDWPADQIKTMKVMWADGKSATDIANVIPRSRGAIQGKLWRMGIKREGHKAHSSYCASRRSLRPRVRPIESRPVVQQGGLVRLLDLTDDNCRYFVGDVGQPDAGFCSGTQIELRPDVRSAYCLEHHLATHQPPRER